MSLFIQSCQNFETYLQSHKPKIESFHPYFEQAFWEMVENGGKRFRPSLTLSIVCAKAKEQIINTFDVCLAIECLHTYSLIHDDLPSIDNATLRRNHATLHCKYDEVCAILVGDALNTYSFYLLSQTRFAPDIKIKLIECLGYNGGINGMILGQALDCKFEKETLTQEQLNFVHIHKTAKLIAASLKMGAIIANLTMEAQNVLYDFGLKLGLYFQIRDDIIDSIQDESESGKTVHNDKNKNSYVNLLGLHKAQETLQEHRKLLQTDLQNFKNFHLMDIQHNLEDLLCPYFSPLECVK